MSSTAKTFSRKTFTDEGKGGYQLSFRSSKVGDAGLLLHDGVLSLLRMNRVLAVVRLLRRLLACDEEDSKGTENGTAHEATDSTASDGPGVDRRGAGSARGVSGRRRRG